VGGGIDKRVEAPGLASVPPGARGGRGRGSPAAGASRNGHQFLHQRVGGKAAGTFARAVAKRESCCVTGFMRAAGQNSRGVAHALHGRCRRRTATAACWGISPAEYPFPPTGRRGSASFSRWRSGSLARSEVRSRKGLNPGASASTLGCERGAVDRVV
jgi:hypothetical protein